MFVSLEWLVERTSASHLAMTIVDALATHASLDNDELRNKFTSFGPYGTLIFQVNLNLLLICICIFGSRYYVNTIFPMY